MSEAGSREPWRALEVYIQQWRWKARRREQGRENSSVHRECNYIMYVWKEFVTLQFRCIKQTG